MSLRRFVPAAWAALGVSLLLAACGGGGVDATRPPAEPQVQAPEDGPVIVADGSIVLQPPTRFGNNSGLIEVTWSSSGEASRFSVWLSSGEGREFFAVTNDLDGPSAVVSRLLPSWQYDFPTARVRVRGCNDAGTACSDSNEQPLQDVLVDGSGSLIPPVDWSSSVGGSSVFRLSDDGATIAALRNTDPGMLGNPPENFDPARVDIYVRIPDGRWVLNTQLPTPDFRSTTSAMALSSDGRTLAINLLYSYGGYGPEGVPGVVVVYVRDAFDFWRLEAVLSAPDSGDGSVDIFLGGTLALSQDGRRLAAGGQSGVRVFERDAGGQWRFDSRIAVAYPRAMTMSGNGRVIALTQTAGSVPDDPVPTSYDSVRVFSRNCACGTWVERAHLVSDAFPYAAGPADLDDFGSSLAISHDGSAIVVGAPRLRSQTQPGGVYVFRASQDTWQRSARLATGEPGNDKFGRNVTVSGDGRVIAGSACGRFPESAGVNRGYRAGALPLGDGSCHALDGSAEHSQGAQVFRSDDAGAWNRVAALVPTPHPPTPDQGPAGDGDQLFPLLDLTGQSLVIGTYRDRTTFDGVRGVAALYAY